MPFFGWCVRYPLVYNERVVPTFIEPILCIIDDVGIYIIETRFPRFVLTKKRILRVFSDLAKGEFCRDSLVNDAIIQDKVLGQTNRVRFGHFCFRKRQYRKEKGSRPKG